MQQLLQNIMASTCLIHKMLWNAEAETTVTEQHTNTFMHLHFVTFCYILFIGYLHFATFRELLVTSNFSFSHSVFERLVSQGRQNVSLCGNGLND